MNVHCIWVILNCDVETKVEMDKRVLEMGVKCDEKEKGMVKKWIKQMLGFYGAMAELHEGWRR